MSGNVIHTLACVCTLGFEDVCVRELRGRLADASEDTIEVLPSSCAVTEGRVVVEGRTLYRGDTGCATVLVSTNRDPNSLIHATRSIPYWFAYLAHSATLPTATNGGSRTVNDADHAELELIPELLRRADWISALRTWRAHIGTTDKDDDAPPSFAGRCVRGGNHSFNSQDVALKIGQGVGAVFPSWKVDLKNPAVEVIAIILNETVFLGLHLRTPRTGDKHFNKCKFPTEVRPAIPARTLTTAASSSSSSTSAAEATALAAASAAVGPTVKPSTAFLMLSLLQLHPHELVVDVTCSIGTALIEAAIGHACVALGGDCDERLAPIQRNAASLGGSRLVAYFFTTLIFLIVFTPTHTVPPYCLAMKPRRRAVSVGGPIAAVAGGSGRRSRPGGTVVQNGSAEASTKVLSAHENTDPHRTDCPCARAVNGAGGDSHSVPPAFGRRP